MCCAHGFLRWPPAATRPERDIERPALGLNTGQEPFEKRKLAVFAVPKLAAMRPTDDPARLTITAPTRECGSSRCSALASLIPSMTPSCVECLQQRLFRLPCVPGHDVRVDVRVGALTVFRFGIPGRDVRVDVQLRSVSPRRGSK
jgi:hypothetical protein